MDWYHYQQMVDHWFRTWAFDLSKWIFEYGVTGLIVWWTLYMLTPLNFGFHTFFAFGMAAWILNKVKPRWW